jgi:murein DD-endopeptidase MepM/ murein hydrolase activator NlpD
MTGRIAQGQPFGSHRKAISRPAIAQPERARRFELSTSGVVGVSAAFCLVFFWALGMTGVIVFRDDFVVGAIRREASLQYDYEERISALKAELARLKSRQLVEQQAFADKVDTLMRRQSSLESRQSIVQSLGELATDAGVKNLAPRPLDDTASARPEPDGGPAGDGDTTADRPGKAARLDLRPARHASMLGDLFLASSRPQRLPIVSARLEAIAGTLDVIERRQMQALAELAAKAKARVDLVRDTVDDLGLDADALAGRVAGPSAEGGPFIPLELAPNASAFETVAHDVQMALAKADGLNRGLATLPLRRPFPHAEITSGFGARVDPFLGGSAMHAGIDFREEIGAPVRATASGRVSEAGWVGGYGNMVEIDHGGGIATRYGHLSQILVAPGDSVTIGQVIGRVGSTGRSTGPHLHYETRIGGTPVDPMRFLRAEDRLGKAS